MTRAATPTTLNRTLREADRRMSWARLDDGFHDHPKVDGLSLAAVGLWTLSLTWAHRHRRTAAKPGHIPVTRVRKLAGRSTRTLANELVACALWEELPNGDGWLIHDFADYLARERDPEELAAAGRKGAQNRWLKNGKQPSPPIADSHQIDGKPIANPMADDGSRASAPAFPTRPDPTRSSNNSSEGGLRTSPRDPEDPPPEFCDQHPTGTDQPCGPCGDARRRHDTWKTDQAQQRLTAAIALKNARDQCDQCDDNGFITEPDTGIPLGRCTHQPIGADA